MSSVNRWPSVLSWLVISCSAVLIGCHQAPPVSLQPDAFQGVDNGEDALAMALRGHIRVLASDSFEGRFPTRRGGTLTVEYLTEAFRDIGLQPGNPDGSFVQRVPLIEYSASTVLTHINSAKQLELESPHDLFAWSVDLREMPSPQVALYEKEIVFAGYGIDAPEYDWDDFGDVDLTGKVVLVLPGDPPRTHQERFPDDAPSRHSTAAAKGAAAAARGAVALIIIVDPTLNGSPYEVFAHSLGRERIVLPPDEDPFAPDTPSPPDATAPGRGMVMSPAAAAALFENAGSDYHQLFTDAASPDFRVYALPGRANVTVRARANSTESHNVVGLVPGGHPQLRNQLVVYLAHWDHIGRDTTLTGDQIFNGAMDNAAGTAQLIEVARKFAERDVPPNRSILFIGTTAEEANLLGSTYYAANPLFHLECTVAALNLDGGFPFGRTHDVVAIGAGNTTLDELLEDALRAQGRWRTPDFRETAYFQRSDHFAFARVGVPALFFLPGTDAIGRPVGWGEMMLTYFMENHYHLPSDTLRTDYDLRGLAEDARLMYDVGLRVAADATIPMWTTETPHPEYAELRATSLTAFGLDNCALPQEY